MTDAPATSTPPPAIEAVMREQALAVGYAPAAAREGFAALLDVDHQLASILQSTTEPMIGQMRLTWWYEALEKLDREPAPAHPVLQRLAASVLPAGVLGADLAPMIEGWEALLDDGEALDDERVTRHAQARGGVLFASIGRLLGGEGWEPLGVAWAKADLAGHISDKPLADRMGAQALGELDTALSPKRARGARGLSGLSVLAREGLRHPDRLPGHPLRAARLAWHGLTGR
ncbi:MULTISPECIES: squalene/phytoene synthase family protein [unclassified Sphingomonas]|uniref:squalene/phytoene synthase family protein n=1 Tax=unclassified Sphingomonas TaxID=196159 RepID=UPI0028584D80|nr:MULTISPECIES: squalene/phytoene synthase family protein [unclassified Sphingomonas]MDR6116331.1 phytoene synthase [Sphingomonas sp. SORGH_AS_0789]MDR6149994.1 phytoene synthase [Sphingomonas sp. SORGH_AS_0742]